MTSRLAHWRRLRTLEALTLAGAIAAGISTWAVGWWWLTMVDAAIAGACMALLSESVSQTRRLQNRGGLERVR